MNKKTITKIILAVAVIIVVKKGVSFVYDNIQVMNAPTMQEIREANPWTVPADWFKTDTITIKGHIEDYDAERFGFSSMAAVSVKTSASAATTTSTTNWNGC